MSRRKVGRTRERLAEVILRDLGLVVDPADLWMQEGFYRSRYHDLARWGSYDAHDPKDPPAIKTHIASWDTMTECVRRGVASFDGGGYVEITVR
jgi:hypothetical protein